MRNAPFAVMVIQVIVLSFMHGFQKKDWDYVQLAVTVTLSFVLYLPVVLARYFVPLLGMFMIPKTLAYVWIVVIGYIEMCSEINGLVVVVQSTTNEEAVLSGSSDKGGNEG